MLKLNASYSKKVPAETEYSSQSYHCTIEVELPDGLTGQQLQEKVHSVFEFVRTSVEAELHETAQQNPAPQGPVQQQPVVQQPAALPPTVARQPVYPQSTQQPNQYPQPQGRQFRNPAAPASTKQINYLLSLAKRAGWTIQQILQHCKAPSVEAIPAKVCSQLIQEFSGVPA